MWLKNIEYQEKSIVPNTFKITLWMLNKLKKLITKILVIVIKKK